jgi:tRNA A37 threonylcarbamoyladenosine dehydratase
MNKEQVTRTIALLGEENYNKLAEKCVMVVGLGGVGGTAIESLVRTGINKVIIVDYDVVSLSNLNRQILYTRKDVGLIKSECAKQHLLAINPELDIVAINMKVDEDNINLLKQYNIDYVVDAIDDINAKVTLIKFACESNIPIIVSLGMANKLDPRKIDIIRLDKTTDDPLAKKLRYEVKKKGLSTKEIMTVFSSEKPKKDGSNLNSVMFPPSTAGLTLAYKVIDDLINKEK